MAYGTLSLSDLLATTSQSIAQFGPGYEEQIWEVFRRSLDAHNRIMNELMQRFVERTTERLIGYGGVQTMQMDDIDEYGSPHVQKVAPGENLGFPLRMTGIALQWTLTYFEEATPADVAGQMIGAQDADRRRVTRDIKRALYTPTNTAFVDFRTKDRPTLPVKALANADGMSVPIGPNGETFNGATHTHYLGTSGFAATDLTAGIVTVSEHFQNNEIEVSIASTEEPTIRAMTGTNQFVPVVDNAIVQPLTATYARGDLNYFDFNNRRIGRFQGADVWVRPWAVPGYVVFTNLNAPSTLAMREKRQGSGDFRMVYEDESHPLRAKAFQREYGIAPRRRWNAAVLDVAHASYNAPTIT